MFLSFNQLYLLKLTCSIQLLAEELKGFKEVSVTPKPINVVGKENPAVEAVIDSIKNSWAVEQGQKRQVNFRIVLNILQGSN